MSNARLSRSGSVSFSAGGADPVKKLPSLGFPSADPVKLPPIDEALIQHLEGAFKFTPSASHDLRALDRAVGHWEVIEHLRAVYSAQQDEPL